MKQITAPFPLFVDRAGDPLDAGYVYIGAVHQNPETSPIAVYWDDAGTQPAAQPLRTSAGRIVNGVTPARVYIASEDYSMTVKDKAQRVVFSVSGVDSIGTLQQDLSDSADPSKGAALIGYKGRTVSDRLSEIVSVKDFGAVGDGITNDGPAIQAAINSLTNGGIVLVPIGVYLVAGDGFVDIKPGVTLKGSGAASRIVSGTGGRNGNHVFVYLKDGAAIEDLRLSGSNYARQSGGPNYIAFNKIGITTQGASVGENFRVSRVGFEKFINSHVFVFNGHRNALIEGCYTFGQQIGSYADVGGDYIVTNWNASDDALKQLAGTQVYCLTNFYNSGTSSTNVVITNGRHTNINDAFVGINGNSSRHTITNNIFIKNASGFYGGWGVDINTGDDCVVTGNYIEGGSAGVHLFSSKNCTVSGNALVCDRGVWLDDPSTEKNTISGNSIKLTQNAPTVPVKIGVSVVGAVNNAVCGNVIDAQSISGAKGVYLEASALGNSFSTNTIIDAQAGIESSGASSDANWSFSNVFRNVTTRFPRAINSNYFQNVKGLSGTDVNANNLGGTVVVTGTNTSQAVVFANLEPDANYRIMLAPRSSSGTPAAGAFTPLPPSSVMTSGFTVNVAQAPGAGNSVSFNWFLYRA